MYNIGNFCGYIVKFDGVIIYYVGDIFVFGDMVFFNEFYGLIDVVFFLIGGYFMMGLREVVKVVEFFKLRKVVLMYYNIWLLIV